MTDWCVHHPALRGTEALGELVAGMHGSPAGATPPSVHDRLGRRWARQSLAGEDLPPALVEIMRSPARVVEEASSRFGYSFLRGGLIPSNVLWSPSGPVLVDLELSSSGPPWWYAARMLVHLERFGAPDGDAETFPSGYGSDPRDDSLFRRLRRVRDAVVTVSAIGRAQVGGSGV